MHSGEKCGRKTWKIPHCFPLLCLVDPWKIWACHDGIEGFRRPPTLHRAPDPSALCLDKGPAVPQALLAEMELLLGRARAQTFTPMFYASKFPSSALSSAGFPYLQASFLAIWCNNKKRYFSLWLHKALMAMFSTEVGINDPQRPSELYEVFNCQLFKPFLRQLKCKKEFF